MQVIAESSEIKPPSTDLWVPIDGDPGEGGGGWENFDWNGGAGTEDWGNSASSWQQGDPIPTVIVTGDKMTVWEKIEYDANSYANEFAAGLDNAISEFESHGFVSVGATGVLGFFGAGITVDSSKDIYVSFNAGLPGVSISAGLTPNGMTQSEFLTEMGASAHTALGIGFTSSSGGTVPSIGTPGIGFSYTVNASQAWENFDLTGAVIRTGTRWYNEKYGVSD